MDSFVKSITVTGKDSYCTEMMKRLDIQRRNELFCDVVVEVGPVDDQARLKGHRNVLCAASPFFYGALNSDMKENKEGEIRLEETNKALIEELIDYLYSGHVEVTKENATQLFGQADYFLISSLKALSSRFTNSSLEAIVDTAEYCTEMMKGLHIQRKNGHFCDVSLEGGSGDGQALLKAHRNVLCAASPFFYTALNSDMKEKKEGVIQLKETTKSVMEQILEFLYTGHVEVNNEENAYELLTQADYFLIPSLKALSGKFIVKTLDVSNCLVVYNFAIEYHGEELKNGARDFILANLVAVSDTEDFLNVSGKEIEEWISSDEVIVKQEEEIFEMIVKWMEKKNRQDQDFLQLLRHVRCVFLSQSYVFDVMLQHPLVKANAVCSEFILDAMKEVPDDHTDQCFFSQSPRNCLKTHEDAIVAIGLRETDCYIPSEDKWYMLPDNPSRNYFYRYGMSSIHGKLYAIGKYSDQNGSIVEYYDPSSNLWTPVSAPGITKREMAVVTLQGLLYVVGGRDENDIALSTVQRYNPDADQWEEVSSLSSPRSDMCAVAHGNYLYAIGGRRVGLEILGIVERFDPRENTWENLPSLLTERSFASGVGVKGKVFVFGGLQPSSRDGDPCEVYDPETNMWSGIPSDGAPRCLLSVANFINGKILVYGIFDELLGGRRIFQLYDVEKNEWKPFPGNVPYFRWHEITPLRISRDVLANCREISGPRVGRPGDTSLEFW